MTLKHQ